MYVDFNWFQATASSPVFLVIVGCSIVTLAIALERAWYFWKHSGNPEQALGQALKKIQAGQLREAAWACESSAHPMGAVAVELFKGDGGDAQSLGERIHVALSQQKLLLERNLSILGTMAAIAPLIGLLGTVWGIMRAFHDMALTGSAAPTVVAAGVAEALTTTAAGLVVAVPALVLYNHFTNRMNVMLTVAENHTRSLRTAVIETAGGGDAPGGGPGVRDQAGTARAARTETPEPAATR
jgi:biopolymer transport protein ExbB